MAGFAELQRFGLTLPDAVLQPLMGQPSLRARGKMFALWWEPDKTVILKLDREHQHMLFEVRPKVFTPCKVGTGTWSYVDIAKLTRKELHALILEAWSQVVATKTSSPVLTREVRRKAARRR